jgi:oligopeptide transport system ATP-binding protein
MSNKVNSKNNKKEFQAKFDYKDATELLKVKHLKQYFDFKGRNPKYLKAVHDVSFTVYKGEVFGLVGESGCGKTTTGRDIMKLYKITSGDIWLDGVRIAAGTRWNEKEIKYTNIRAEAAIKKIREQKKAVLDEFTKNFLKITGKKPLLLLLKEKERFNSWGKDEEKERDLYKEYLGKIAPLDQTIALEKSKAKTVHDIQIDKIKAAKEDDKNYNKNIAHGEVERVKAKYATLLAKIADSNNIESLSPEELESYKAYKDEIYKAKHANIANKVQMIFQDPIASLNPRMTVRNIIAEGLIIQGCHDKEFINKEVARVLTLVGLVPEHANRYPHEFSGGQRQRIGIARAIIMHPELIVADEPVSALDVSVQAQVINLLNELRNDLGLTIIFIAHNLSVVKYFCDRIAVMYYGVLVEVATSEELFKHPLHPYTRSLLSAVPYPDPIIEANRKRIVYDPSKEHDYSKQKPTFREIKPGHFVYCNDEEEKKYLKVLNDDE